MKDELLVRFRVTQIFPAKGVYALLRFRQPQWPVDPENLTRIHDGKLAWCIQKRVKTEPKPERQFALYLSATAHGQRAVPKLEMREVMRLIVASCKAVLRLAEADAIERPANLSNCDPSAGPPLASKHIRRVYFELLYGQALQHLHARFVCRKNLLCPFCQWLCLP